MEENPLYISKRGRRGVIALVLVCLAIIYFPRVYSFFKKPLTIDVSYSQWQDIHRLKRKPFFTNRFKNFTNKSYDKASRFKLPPRKFNPNEYALENWTYLGLSEKQAAIVLKFTKYGLKSNEDLKRIFVINDELFDLIKDSTFYPQKPTLTEEKPLYVKEEKKVVRAEINTSSLDELTELKGIGPFFAKQIIRYRDQLGGFVRREQLMEVWKMTVETYDLLTPQIDIQPDKVRKLKLNDIDAETLQAHPYLNWSQANSIVKMRMQRGKFNSVDEIKDSKLIDEETFQKLLPYLSL